METLFVFGCFVNLCLAFLRLAEMEFEPRRYSLACRLRKELSLSFLDLFLCRFLCKLLKFREIEIYTVRIDSVLS